MIRFYPSNMQNQQKSLASCRLHSSGKIHLVNLLNQGTAARQMTFCGRRLSASQHFSDDKQFDKGERCCVTCIKQWEEKEVCDRSLQKNVKSFREPYRVLNKLVEI